MAKAKKTTKAKKVARKIASKPRTLTSDDRRRLLKPPEAYAEVVERFVRTWQSNRALRVPGLTAARLTSLLKKARRASEREDDFRTRLEQRLRPLSDGRLLAEDAAWRALLDANAAVKTHTRVDAAMGEAFAFLADVFTRRAATRDAEEDPAPKP